MMSPCPPTWQIQLRATSTTQPKAVAGQKLGSQRSATGSMHRAAEPEVQSIVVSVE